MTVWTKAGNFSFLAADLDNGRRRIHQEAELRHLGMPFRVGVDYLHDVLAVIQARQRIALLADDAAGPRPLERRGL